MNLREQLEQSLNRFEELEQLMTDPAVLSDSTKMASFAREHGSLSKVAGKYRAYKRMTDDMRELAEMANSSDPDERAMATEELERFASIAKSSGPSCLIFPSVAKMPIACVA
jgi:peptide chain release factor 1